jgi:hypothetical protein
MARSESVFEGFLEFSQQKHCKKKKAEAICCRSYCALSNAVTICGLEQNWGTYDWLSEMALTIVIYMAWAIFAIS